jgi:ferric-dicitrate binding protein FerR (iron transport regulator)
MAQETNRISYLTRRYLDSLCTPAEMHEFLQIIEQLEYGIPVRQELDRLWQVSADAKGQTSPGGWEKILRCVYQEANQWSQREQSRGNRQKMNRWTVAAASLLVIAAASWLFFFQPARPAETLPVSKVVNDIKAPLTNRAVLILDNGQKVYLDSVKNGVFAQQDGIQLVKTDNGALVYQVRDRNGTRGMGYNTLTNPKASRTARLTLTDGTRVWLNAGSSLTYPVIFTGRERKVSVSGEAYFEVTHEITKFFIVSKDRLSIRVLGTHFNVKAYDDDPENKVTLLQGRISVSQDKASRIVRPGQQTRVANQRILIRKINTQQAVAWKNGIFDFGEGTGLKDIMRQVARWYDVTIDYQGDTDPQLGGEISRQMDLSKLLEKLELTGLVKFQMEERKIIVTLKTGSGFTILYRNLW